MATGSISRVGRIRKKAGGRKPARQNKLTRSAKKEAFQVELVAWAKDNQDEFYKLYARLMIPALPWQRWKLPSGRHAVMTGPKNGPIAKHQRDAERVRGMGTFPTDTR